VPQRPAQSTPPGWRLTLADGDRLDLPEHAEVVRLRPVGAVTAASLGFAGRVRNALAVVLLLVGIAIAFPYLATTISEALEGGPADGRVHPTAFHPHR
jgi:hypothetical protein